ncbi:uncharacterized protein LOC120137206 isoform X2 [Hibiscus syriacus]|nr:uncharacterized protein LOC120137206 isoform X2 [Hibiscus syriacus]
MDKSYRSSRGSASPNRLSPSPRSTSSTLQSRGRPSSAPQSSPIRQPTPTRRPSPSPSRSSTPAQRSSTPTPQITSTGRRGASPVRTSRGNSTSPKTRAWQSNIPGFSLDAPPNLRTSLGDRPASYVRGSSPASRNGREARFGRKSMSPTASRSVSSSYSHDRDQLSSYSRGSVASSGDDDLDPLQSIPLSGSTLSVPRRLGTYTNNRGATFNKKSARVLSPSSAPKRSFDSALRQMAYRKSPPNMFRPLLSSVPSTTFYVGKGSSAHGSLMSKNSSVTTSSNANCHQGSSAVLNTEGSNQHDDGASESGRGPFANVLEEGFAFDKMDAVNQDASYETRNDSLNILIEEADRDSKIQCDPDHSGEFSHHGLEVEITSNYDALCERGDLSEVDSFENTKICSNCYSRYRVIEQVEEETSLCTDCTRQHDIVAGDVSDAKNYPGLLMKVSGEDKPIPDLEISIHPSDSPLQVIDAHYSDEHSGLKVNTSEVVGISVLLKRSGSSKGPVVLGRTFSTIPSEDLSYARDSYNSFRSSFGHGSVSVSSSVEFSSRQTDTCVQLNARKSELENYRYGLNAKPQSFTLSQSSSNNYQALSLASSTNDENFESSVRSLKFEEAEEIAVVSQAKASENSEVDSSFPAAAISNAAAISKTDSIEWNGSSRVIDTLTSESLEDNSAAPFPLNDDGVSYENGDNFSSNARIASSVEALPATLDPTLEEHGMQNDIPDGVDAVEGAGHTCLTTISEIEIDKSCRSSYSSELDGLSPNSERKKKRSMDLSDAIPLDVDITASVEEHDSSDHTVGVLEESTVLVECRGGSKARSLTLEEATDTILFCSSIIHDLAYEAATIAIERESSVPLECSRPTVTILGKSTSDRKDLPGRTVGRWTSKSNKVRQRRVETDVKSVPTKTVNDENAYESSNHNVDIPDKMDSMNPPKLESKCNCFIM